MDINLFKSSQYLSYTEPVLNELLRNHIELWALSVVVPLLIKKNNNESTKLHIDNQALNDEAYDCLFYHW